MNSQVTTFVLPRRIKLDATAKIVPARTVSTVSCSGSTHDSPLVRTNGTTASYIKLSRTHNSRRTRRSTDAMRGPYSTTFSRPTSLLAVNFSTYGWGGVGWVWVG